MEKGLRNILGRIAKGPANKVLQSRFLALASELPEQDKLEAVLALAQVFIETSPKDAIRLARMVREDHPAAYREQAAKIVRMSIPSEGSKPKAASPAKKKAPVKAAKKKPLKKRAPKATIKKPAEQKQKVAKEAAKTQLIIEKEPRVQFGNDTDQAFTRVASNVNSITDFQQTHFTTGSIEPLENEGISIESASTVPEVNENDTFVDLVLDQIPSSSKKSIEVARKQKKELSSLPQKSAFFTVDIEPTVSKMSMIGMTLEESEKSQRAAELAIEVSKPAALGEVSTRSDFFRKYPKIPNTLEDKEVLNLVEYLYGEYPDASCLALLEGRINEKSIFSLRAFYCIALARNGRSRQALYYLQTSFAGADVAQKEHLDTVYSEIAEAMRLPGQANYLERRVLPEYIRQIG